MTIDPATLPSRVPAGNADYDVIVAGGGPAGLAAGLAAAHTGARTLVLEALSHFGGVAAITPWMPMNRLLLNDAPRGFVHDLLVAKLRALGPDAATGGTRNEIDADGFNVHPDYVQLAAFELLEDAGCHYRLYSPVTGVLMDGSRLRGVVTERKGHRAEFTAPVVIDATGDGDVCRLAGVPMVEGREEDGIHMPVSLVFALGNVEVERFFEFFTRERDRFNAAIEELAAAGGLRPPWFSFHRTNLPGVLGFNHGGCSLQGNIDGTDPADLTRVERLGIQLAVDFIALAHRVPFPGMEHCHLMRLGAQAAVRDTRRIVGEYTLTLEDVEKGVTFPDVVARKYGNIVDANQLYQGRMTSGCHYPYRCLLPKQIDGLLAAGRCGSATFYGHAAGKSMGNMMEIGQAAGVAAALAARQGIAPRQVDVGEIQRLLTQRGVRLG